MSLREKIDSDLKTAMKAHDALRVSVIRMSRSEIRYAEIDKKSPLTEEEVLQVFTKESKKRRDSIEQFQKAGRTELVEKERAELQILSEYLPEQLDEVKVSDIVREVISELHATSKSDKGRVMSAVVQQVRGKADGKLVSQIVDRMLSGSSA